MSGNIFSCGHRPLDGSVECGSNLDGDVYLAVKAAGVQAFHQNLMEVFQFVFAKFRIALTISTMNQKASMWFLIKGIFLLQNFPQGRSTSSGLMSSFSKESEL